MGLKLEFVISAIDRATKTISKVTASLNTMAEPIQLTRQAFSGLLATLGNIVKAAAAAAAAVAGIFAGVKRTADVVDNIADTAASLGMTTQRLQEMAYAAQLSGSSQEEMAQALVFLNKNMGEARRGSKEMQQAFANAGVSMKDLSTMDAGQVMEKIADTFQRVGDAGNNAGKKVELSTTLLSRSGYRMIQMMNGGSAGMKALYAEARRLGVVLDDQTVSAMTSFNDAWDRLRFTLFGAVANALKAVAPLLQTLLERMMKWVVANRQLLATKVEAFVKRVSELLPGFLEGISKIGSAIGRFVEFAGRVADVLGGWPNLMAVVAGVIGAKLVLQVYALVSAIGFLNSVMWANPLTWMLAAVAALVAALPLLVMHLDTVIAKLQQLHDAMPDWMTNKDNWAIFKLLPDIGLKPGGANDKRAGEGASGAQGAPTEQPSGRVPVIVPGAQPAAGKVPMKDGASDIGGTLLIQIMQDAAPKVSVKKNDPESPLKLVYNGQSMNGF
jgi:ABC-type transporter Mla subunit MlaD